MRSVKKSIKGIFVLEDFLFGIIFLLGCLIRVSLIDEPFRNDESVSFLWFASKPIATFVTEYQLPNNHIMHTMMMRACYLAFGLSEISLRLPALLFGIGTLYAVYQLTFLLTNDKNTARLSAFFTAFSKWQVYYSVNARGYIVQTFWAVLMVYVFFLYNQGRLKKPPIIALFLLGFWTIYTVPTGLIFLVPCLLLMGLKPLSKISVRETLLVTFLIAQAAWIAYLPVLPQMTSQGSALLANQRPTDVWLEVLTRTSDGLMPWPLLFSLGIAAVFYTRGRKSAVFFLAGLFFIFPFIEFAMNLGGKTISMFSRYYLLTTPFIYILAAMGFSAAVNILPITPLAVKYLRRLPWIALIAHTGLSLRQMFLDKSTLYNPDRNFIGSCRDLALDVAPQLGPDDRIYGMGIVDCEPVVIMHTVQQKGFNGFYGLRDYESAPIKNIFIIGKSAHDIRDFSDRTFAKNRWMEPQEFSRRASAVCYKITAKPGAPH